jgi:hypothetical protein
MEDETSVDLGVLRFFAGGVLQQNGRQGEEGRVEKLSGKRRSGPGSRCEPREDEREESGTGVRHVGA